MMLMKMNNGGGRRRRGDGFDEVCKLSCHFNWDPICVIYNSNYGCSVNDYKKWRNELWQRLSMLYPVAQFAIVVSVDEPDVGIAPCGEIPILDLEHDNY